MAFTTKLNLTNQKVYQDALGVLYLSGQTSFADARYLEAPTITDPLQIPNAAWVTGQTGAIGASNGLNRVGDNIVLGGTLTSATTIDINGQSLTFTTNPIEYGGDYSSQFGEHSLVTGGFVTGITSLKLNIADFNSYSSTTDTRISSVETDVSNNATDIASVSAQTNTNATNIATNATDISTNAGNISTNTTNIATNSSNITTLQSDVTTNTSNITANATDISTLQTDVSSIQTDVSNNTTAIGDNTTAISNNASEISSNTTAIAQNTFDIGQNASEISTNAAAITQNVTDIAQNASDISSNSTLIGANTTNIATNTSDIATNTFAIGQNTTAIGDNATCISQIELDLGNVTTDVTQLQTDVAQNTTDIGNNAANIATNATDIATNASNISTNTGNISTNTSNIATNTSDIATLQANSVSTAVNGLTKTGTVVKLGGSLTENTNIDGQNAQSFDIESMSSYNVGAHVGVNCACTYGNTFEVGSRWSNNSASGNFKGLNLSSSGMIVTDSLATTGLEYAADYSTNGGSNPLWLPSNEYVTGITSTKVNLTDYAAYTANTDTRLDSVEADVSNNTTNITNNTSDIAELSASTVNSVTGGTNGLTLNGRDLELGGTLNSNTTIIPDAPFSRELAFGAFGNSLDKIDINANCTVINAMDSGFQSAAIVQSVTSGGYNNGANASIAASHVANNSSAGVAATTGGTCMIYSQSSRSTRLFLEDGIIGVETTPAILNFSGITYDKDYSDNYTNRSLVDKEYVDGATGGIGAANGLTRVDGNITLGGSLTGATTIDSGVHDHCLIINSPFCASDVHVIDFDLSPTISDHKEGRLYYKNCALNFDREISGVTTQINEEAVIRTTNITGNLIENGSVVFVYGAASDLPTIDKAIASSFIEGTQTIGLATHDIANNNEGYVTNFGIVNGVNTGAYSVGDILWLSDTVDGGYTNVRPDYPSVSVSLGMVLKVGTSDGQIFVRPLYVPPYTEYGEFTGYTATTELALNNKLEVSLFDTYSGVTDGRLDDLETSDVINITGVTNGLTKVGDKDAKLGGSLTEATVIDGAFNFTIASTCDNTIRTQGGSINVDAQTNGTVALKSQSGSLTNPGTFTDAIGIYADFDQASGFVVYDNRAGSAQEGMRYAADYSGNYTDRSLVDKAYVDSIATGLATKGAVLVATTGSSITLSGLQTIDGVAVSDGNRVLVKDQTNEALNGIYSASTGAWGRVSDYDFSPVGEIANGDLIPVVSGDTFANTQWSLTTQDPVVSGDSLTFTLFSRLLQISGGDGIDITPSGGNEVISVDLANNSALEFRSNQLSIANEIAGDGLTWTDGVLDINASSVAPTGVEIPVRFGTGNDLFVDSDDFSYTNASNGLTKVGDFVSLGGALTGNTAVDGNSGAYDLSFADLNSFNLGFDSVSTITDSGTNGGLRYAADYSANYNNRSIPDVEFVNDAITGNTLNYNNGLTKQGDTISWGGTLTGDTAILHGTTNFCIMNGINPEIDLIADCSCVSINTTDISINTCSTAGSCESSINMTPDGAMTIVANNDTTGIVVAAPTSGITYAGDYESGFSSRSLVTKQYVDSNAGAIQGVNGLSRVDNSIALGGIMTGDTVISGATNNMSFGTDASKFAQFNICSNQFINVHGDTVSSIGSRGTLHLELCCSTLASCNPSGGGTEIYMDQGVGIRVHVNSTSNAMFYEADYSGLYNDRSIPDVGYVTGVTDVLNTDIVAISAQTDTNTTDIATITGLAITGASNGISQVGQVLELGGVLTKDTTISGNALYDLNVTGATEITLESTSNVNMTGVVKLLSTPDNGNTATDSVLVWNSGDKIVKQIDATELGEDNNDYNVTGVTNSVVNLTGTEYVVLVSTSSAAVIVNLPNNPPIGTAIKIKDKGNALTNNITVDAGSGRLIDNNRYATINTDYGALELVYGETNTWYSLSFIN